MCQGRTSWICLECHGWFCMSYKKETTKKSISWINIVYRICLNKERWWVRHNDLRISAVKRGFGLHSPALSYLEEQRWCEMRWCDGWDDVYAIRASFFCARLNYVEWHTHFTRGHRKRTQIQIRTAYFCVWYSVLLFLQGQYIRIFWF